jgi:hypothetical protein
VCECAAMPTHRGKRHRLVHVALTCATVLSLAAATAGQADAARKRANPCATHGSKTVLATGSARVYTKRGPKRPASADPSTLTRLCGSLAGKRPVKMATAGVYSAGTLSFGLEQLAGRFASAVTISNDRGGHSEELEAYDLRRRRRASITSLAPEAEFKDVVLMPSGNTAWIQTAQSPGQDPNAEPVFNSFEVRARQGAKTILLDSGAGIVPTSLASSGSTLYWTNGARVGTARLP